MTPEQQSDQQQLQQQAFILGAELGTFQVVWGGAAIITWVVSWLLTRNFAPDYQDLAMPMSFAVATPFAMIFTRHAWSQVMAFAIGFAGLIYGYRQPWDTTGNIWDLSIYVMVLATGILVSVRFIPGWFAWFGILTALIIPTHLMMLMPRHLTFPLGFIILGALISLPLRKSSLSVSGPVAKVQPVSSTENS